MIAVEETKQKKQIFFLNSIRIAILCALSLIVFIVFLFFGLSAPVTPLLISMGAAVLISISYFFIQRVLRIRPMVILELSLDILIITVLVYFSGGIVSPFYFLYILPIILAAFFLSRKETFYFSFFSFILFGVLSNLLYLDLIPFFPGIGVDHVPISTYIYNLLMSFIAFSTVSILASYFFRKISETGEELRNIRENLHDMILLNNSVLEKMDSGFITSDSRGRIISYNERAFSLIRINSSRNIFDVLISDEELEDVLRLDKDSNHFYIEKRIGLLDLGISVTVLEMISGFDRLFVFLLTDLTERKKIELKLKEKENLAMVGQMLAGIAHEIRNPLASISGSVQFLQNECTMEPEFRNLMDIIVRESERLSRSINSILDFSKQVPLNLERFQLSLLVDEIVQMVSHNHPQIRFIRHFSEDNEIEADAEKIKQVVWNLLINGIKAVRERGAIEITIFHKNDIVCLSIRDNGIGMDKEELSQVFSLFYSRFTAGVGLGLHTVKRILDEHGFHIEIHSEKNKGTEVVVCFKNK